MNFNKHLELTNKHALFSPSQPSWLNYDNDAIDGRIDSRFRKDLGTLIHEFASTSIILRHTFETIEDVICGVETYIYQKFLNQDSSSLYFGSLTKHGQELLMSLNIIPVETWDTVKAYINDGSNFNMVSEQPLIYSERIFGTADAIKFDDHQLKIMDLKTGSLPVHPEQLMTYAALFCLEYKQDPKKIEIELRIYQNGNVNIFNPEPAEISAIMKQIALVERRFKRISKNTIVKE